MIADFDDGHVLGKAIYQYRLTENSELQFELLSFNVPE
ncbi:hypothetical protein NMS_0379 [Nonlabens marinus S1-08]|uniref:Uncharacterized protein n=1 Tax=Nonlabens marinus S1-08 TaxID=1454201 RepID=W8VU88_9FLAO|nr:hypothetical protein NMS_0379 [Nonlabens marinus S1-08]